MLRHTRNVATIAIAAQVSHFAAITITQPDGLEPEVHSCSQSLF